MSETITEAIWNFDSATSLFKSLEQQNYAATPSSPLLPPPPKARQVYNEVDNGATGLGDFSLLWDYLSSPAEKKPDIADLQGVTSLPPPELLTDAEQNQASKGVRWRDEYDGADLEDNVEPAEFSAASLETRKRALRRIKQKEREAKEQALANAAPVTTDTATDVGSGEELEALRRSPDRRAVISEILGRPRIPQSISPPTSPSPPKDVHRSSAKKDWPISNPFLWTKPNAPSPGHTRITVTPNDGLNPTRRKAKLLNQLTSSFPDERKYLLNSCLREPTFTPLNISPIGIHVFVDMSNISIGFHDCLKVCRDIPISYRVPRIPMNFHNLSLVLERGRPAAKRALVGSDRTSAINQAERLGYEANILDRVHKAKQLTPRQTRLKNKSNNSGYGTGSGLGETSGSETNNTGSFFSSAFVPAKYHEQGVDEILHLKMMESLVDAEKPGTLVLATGDAAEAEYSAGFMKMVERALGRGWMVELVSFKLNTSSLYKRKEFREKWGNMFKWITLDEWAEMLIDERDTNDH